MSFYASTYLKPYPQHYLQWLSAGTMPGVCDGKDVCCIFYDQIHDNNKSLIEKSISMGIISYDLVFRQF